MFQKLQMDTDPDDEEFIPTGNPHNDAIFKEIHDRDQAAHKALEEYEATHDRDGNKIKNVKEEICSKLDSHRFDISKLHDKPDSRISLNQQCLSTVGNLTVIQAKPKAGKTAVISAIMSAGMSDDLDEDYLGFKCSGNKDGHAVIHFDSEQSPYDFEQVILRAKKRVNNGELPSWLRSYSTTGWSSEERRNALEIELKRAKEVCGGVFMVLVDGIVDLQGDPNDQKACNAYVDRLHALAVEYATVLVLVIHENPGTEQGKTRGHFGSQLERKAECNIRIDRVNSEDVIEVYTDRSRSCFIAKGSGVTFKWSTKHQMHVSCDKPEKKDKKDGKYEAVHTLDEFLLYFEFGRVVSHGDALKKAKKHMSPATFNRKLSLAIEKKKLCKKAEGYERCD